MVEIRSLLCWTEVGEVIIRGQNTDPRNTLSKSSDQAKMHAVVDRQKSCADLKRNRKGGEVAYKLELPEELSRSILHFMY
ncbi:hypothetical protein Tco_0088130 [Tanacetum coccineum]